MRKQSMSTVVKHLSEVILRGEGQDFTEPECTALRSALGLCKILRNCSSAEHAAKVIEEVYRKHETTNRATASETV